MHSEVACYVNSVVEGIPAFGSKMYGIRMVTAADTEFQSVIMLIKKVWPEHLSSVSMDAKEYVQLKLEL